MAFASESAWELLDAWDGLGVVVRHDESTGTRVFVALHDDTLGRPVGGCRMMVYPRPEEGLRDALRLAEGMTRKWAALGLPFGGGKAVLAVRAPLAGEARSGLLVRFGRLVESLQGAFATGEDLGTTPDDMRVVASATRHVMGLPPYEGGPDDPGPFTAAGVLAGIRSALGHRHGDRDLRGRVVLVQGVGDVGAPLARGLAEEGARVLLCDVDRDLTRALSDELGATAVDAEDAYTTECDVYAPCAVGATLNRDTVALLRCDIVAGSANNQLEEPEDALRLLERGILYAPDYVINGGGAMAFGLLHLGVPEEDLPKRVEGIGATLDEVFAEAAAERESPVATAERRVRRALAAARHP